MLSKKDIKVLKETLELRLEGQYGYYTDMLERDYEYSDVEKRKEEIKEEVQSLLNLFKELFKIDLSSEFKFEDNKEKPKQKRLSHQKFNQALNNDLGIISEDFYSQGMNSYYEPKDGYTMLIANRSTYCENKTEYALWINYQTRELMLYLPQEDEAFMKLFNKYYDNKGYKINLTKEFKWSA